MQVAGRIDNYSWLKQGLAAQAFIFQLSSRFVPVMKSSCSLPCKQFDLTWLIITLFFPEKGNKMS